MAIYDAEVCRRKADQHYEMAGLARQDGDTKDCARHTELAKIWDQRAKEGGHQE
jgi:hypothetical protein